jgi:hypothetical protein
MMTKLSLGTLLNGPVPARSSLPDADAVRRLCDDAARATDKIASERQHLNVGARLKKAVQARLRPRAVASAESNEGGGDFAEKLKRAVQRKTNSPAKHKERAEQQRDRYPKPRKPTKSE